MMLNEGAVMLMVVRSIGCEMKQVGSLSGKHTIHLIALFSRRTCRNSAQGNAQNVAPGEDMDLT